MYIVNCKIRSIYVCKTVECMSYCYKAWQARRYALIMANGMISHDGASHEPYFWRLLLINTPDFNVPPDCYIVTKHLNKVFSAGGVLKEPTAAIPAWLYSLLLSKRGC